MHADLDLLRPALTNSEVAAIAQAIYRGALGEESHYLEWKRGLDLTTRPRRAQVAKHMIGFANRDSARASARFGGYAYLFLGLEPGAVGGIAPCDPADLDHWVRPYTGDALSWEGRFIELEGSSVLALIVDPPRPGDPIFSLARASEDEAGRTMAAGTIYVRHSGRTEPATHADLDRLQRRLAERLPALTVQTTWNCGRRGTWIGIEVINPPGGCATSIEEAGFTLEGLATLNQLPDVDYAPGEPSEATGALRFPLPGGYPLVVPPGAKCAVTVEPAIVPPLLDADTDLIPYIIDVSQRQIEGRAESLYRRLLDHGWQETPYRREPLEEMLVRYETPDSVRGLVARFDLGETASSSA